jgi:hypothetical protein
MTFSRSRLVILSAILIIASILSSSIYLAFLSAQTAPRRAITLSWPFEFSINIDTSSFQRGVYGDNVSITLTLRNISNKTTEVAWYSYFLTRNDILPFNVRITYENDSYVFEVAKVFGQLGASLSKTLEPDAQLVATFVWHQWWDTPERPLVQKGTYYAKGLTRNMEVTMDGLKQTMQLQTPAMSFTIE